jgi:hypothetical protein
MVALVEEVKFHMTKFSWFEGRWFAGMLGRKMISLRATWHCDW